MDSAGLNRIKRGFIWLAGGCAVTLATYGIARGSGGGFYLVTSGAILFGLIDIVIGIIIYLHEQNSSGRRLSTAGTEWTGWKPSERPIYVPREQKGERQPEALSLGPREEKWQALLKYDDEIRAAADRLKHYGDKWVHALGHGYFALDENKTYLASIVTKLVKEAEEDRQGSTEWRAKIVQLYNRERCTEESLAILKRAHLRGYEIKQEGSGTIAVSMPGRGTSFLRSNEDIKRFATFL